MSLDLGETIVQLDRVSESLGQGHGDRTARLEHLREAASAVSPLEAQRLTSAPGIPFLAAQVMDTLLGNLAPPPPPEDWTALSVDGSHIDVDRHLPVPCYLLNLGGCILTYGEGADARFFSRPHLAAREEELYLRDPGNASLEEAMTGNLLGLYRTVRELTVLLDEARQCPDDRPVLALVDGTLVLWGLARKGLPGICPQLHYRGRAAEGAGRVPETGAGAAGYPGGLRVPASDHGSGERHPPVPLQPRPGAVPEVVQLPEVGTGTLQPGQ